MYEDLKGKVAIVTGAGRPNGLGQGMAKRFAREGCQVVITEVARPHADPTYGRGSWENLLDRRREIEALGARCLPLRCDVTIQEEVESMVDAAIREFGRVDILVNNVGGGPPGSGGPLLEVDAANWDEGMAVNDYERLFSILERLCPARPALKARPRPERPPESKKG